MCVRAIWTNVSVGEVQQVFNPAAFDWSHLITKIFFDDDIAALLSCQQLVDILSRAHGIHLIRL